MPIEVIVLRLFTATILGGLIGIERENRKRAAGFRTHILVSVGAALAMVSSEYIFNLYKGTTNLDPARLGAQVISGIGFLGAGTIIREGANVKGLTTAATLWTVSCVGLAAGMGFYEAAIVATVIIYLTLVFLRKFENVINKSDSTVKLSMKIAQPSEQFAKVDSLIKSTKTKVRKMEIITQAEDNVYLQIVLQIPKRQNKEKIMRDILNLKDENISAT